MKKHNHHHQRARLIGRNGQMNSNIIRLGSSPLGFRDLYHWLLTISWSGFFTRIALVYILSNAIFALAYLAGGDCIANAEPGSFKDVFFFSVQTMATIGYGAMYPRTSYANSIVAIEALFGLLGVAMVTGLAFARFSRPTAKVLFSHIAVITPQNGVPTLMYRTANQRYNQILEAQQRLTLLRDEITADGQFMRRFYDLNLVRSRTPIFALTWTSMHIIDESSPLYGMTAEDFARQAVEIIVTMTGIDETVSQIIHARHSYLAEEILWNSRFVDILSHSPDGGRSIDYTRFHDVIPL
ncbi:ATP-sensitive inward rectifier potassium channel 10 [Oscillatoriales cyanobacterium USR001]|nr:ATP-sensitive inward rectifier potassium channel 10 [Oscillatoriales cyanobacterium USR001]